VKLLSFLLLVLLFATALRADDTLVHARRAQALLGPDVWSRVIRIENTAARSRYPRTVHALVFELAGILWIYADTDGTQSLSLHRGRLAEEKADLAPLLHEIDPGFTMWRELPAADAREFAVAKSLPNGCFIECVAVLRERLALDGDVTQPQLLSYYISTPQGLVGHTVLTYQTRGRLEVIDAQRSKRPWSLSGAVATDALALARAAQDQPVVTARLLPVDLPANSTAARAVVATYPGGHAGLLLR